MPLGIIGSVRLIKALVKLASNTGEPLWLGHESVETTQIYVHADLRLKEKALDRVTSKDSKPGRYRPDDALLAFLEAL